MKLSNETYVFWKKVCQYWIPALGTLYFSIAQILNLPYGEQVVGVLTSIDTFLGVILGISTHMYNKESEDADS